MFRRKKTDGEDDGPEETLAPENLVAPAATTGLRLSVPGVTPTTASTSPTMPNRVPNMPPRPSATDITRVPELPRRPSELGMPASPRAEAEIRQLIVGREISLSGEIKACDRLVVEGSVEANLANCRDIDIADSGLFKGSAAIDEAVIRGRFEGTLSVKGRLYIRATGKVVGTVRYGTIEIERGGQISGDVQSQPADPSPAEVLEEILDASPNALV